jgi:hypothetical protein
MGQVANYLSDRTLSKEENPFYLETKTLLKNLIYKIGPVEKKSEYEIILPISN